MASGRTKPPWPIIASVAKMPIKMRELRELLVEVSEKKVS